MPLIFEIKVVPGSGKQKCILDKSGFLKCYLKNPPEKGLANNELIKFIAKAVELPQQDVEIIAGHSSRKKRICINKEITYLQLLQFLGIDKQEVIDFKKKDN